MTQEAYSYYVVSSPKFYFIYTDNVLLGCVEKKSFSQKPVSLEIKNHHYQLKPATDANGVILITNTTTNNVIGKITISGFGLLSTISFQHNNVTLKWVNKNIFALHWQWQKNNVAIVETVEEFEIGNQKGIVVLSDCFADADLLIMLGVYLRNIVRTLPFNLRYYHCGKEVTKTIKNK